MRGFQIIGLLFVPLFLAFTERNDWRKMVCAFTFGCIVSVWAQANCRGLQTEIYGLIPSAVFAVLLFREPTKRTILVSGLCICFATFFREAYGLGMLAATLFVVRSPKEFLQRFVFPCAIAGGSYLLLLIMSGTIHPFLQLYLPGMLGGRINAAMDGPLFLRAIWASRVFSSLTTYSSFPLLGYCVFVGGAYAITSKRKTDWKMVFLATVTLMIGVRGIAQYWTLLATIYKVQGLAWNEVIFLRDFIPIEIPYVIGTSLYAVLLLYIGSKDREMLLHILVGLLVVPMFGTVISLGGYGRRYLLYLIPALVAIFLALLRKVNVPLMCLIVSLLALSFVVPDTSTIDTETYYHSRQASAQFDRLMDACHFTTYVYGGNSAFLALSRYSPVGPLFLLGPHTYLGFNHPLYVSTIEHTLQTGHLLVEPVRGEGDPYPKELERLFSDPAPPCAKGHTIEGFKLFFRT
jgi:hypothetical protein